MTDLHSALKVEIVDHRDSEGVSLALARLHHSRDSTSLSLHARPSSWSTSGLQTTDLLGYLGFTRGVCALLSGECYASSVEPSFDLEAFAAAFSSAYGALRLAERHLGACGIFLDHPEGFGFFRGRPSQRTKYRRLATGDGHNSPTSKAMGRSEDDRFEFALTWINGGSDKGWTTHYHPKRLPLSPEMESVSSFIGLLGFAECPEFDFDSCYWRFTPYVQRDDSIFGGNESSAHEGFGAHQEHFSPGIEGLLSVQLAMQPFGLDFLPQPPRPRPPAQSSRRSISGEPEQRSMPLGRYEYDVAISFAGPQRPIAEKLAELLRAAGLVPFYDDDYPEQMWGKDLPVFLSEVYREKARYCVILASTEYLERMWTNHERQSAVERALRERGKEYILPVMVDRVQIPGVPTTIGYVSLQDRTVDDIGELLIRKCRGRR